MKYVCTGEFVGARPEVVEFEEVELTTWAGRRGYRVGAWFCEQSQAYDTPAEAVTVKIRETRTEQTRLQGKIENLQKLLEDAKKKEADFSEATTSGIYALKRL